MDIGKEIVNYQVEDWNSREKSGLEIERHHLGVSIKAQNVDTSQSKKINGVKRKRALSMEPWGITQFKRWGEKEDPAKDPKKGQPGGQEEPRRECGKRCRMESEPEKPMQQKSSFKIKWVRTETSLGWFGEEGRKENVELSRVHSHFMKSDHKGKMNQMIAVGSTRRKAVCRKRKGGW